MPEKADAPGGFTLNERYRAILGRLGLDSFGAVMRFGGGELVKDKRIRMITRVAVPAPEPVTLYIKRHFRASSGEFLRRILRGRAPLSPAAQEWRAISALNAAGVETMEAAAFGEGSRLPWARRSFIITADVGGERLEDHVYYLPGNYREKRCIITALADLARAMHAAGLNHRDFYLSHIFLREKGKRCRLALIDLQRVQRRARGFNRWVVKDLAALNYSSPATVVTRTDRMRFLLRYLRAETLGPRAKKLAKRVIRKTRRIREHDRKKRYENYTRDS